MRPHALKLGGRLDRYVGALFVGSYAAALLLVVGLFLVLRMASELDEFLEPWPDGSRAPSLLVVRYYLLEVPFVFLQVAPFVTLVAGLFTVARILKSNEVVAALAAGISAHRLVAPVFAGGFLAAGAMFGLRELLAFDLSNQRDEARFVLEHRTWDRSFQGLWVKDLAGNHVLLTEFRPSVGHPPVAEVRGLRFIPIAHAYTVEAARALYVERDGRLGWWLEGGVRREGGGERAVRILEDFDLTPELALTYHRKRTNPLELSFREVLELARRDPDTVVYRTLLQYLLTFPMANLVLLLVGLPILMRHERGRGAEGVTFGFLLCIFYFAADFVFRNLGMQGAIDPLLAAWVPLLFFGCLGLVLYEGMHT